MNMLKNVSLVCAMGFSMLVAVACSDNHNDRSVPQQQVQQQQYAPAVQQPQQVQPQVVVVQQPAQQVESSSGAGNMVAGAALGGIAGYALANHNRPQVAPQQITKTVVVHHYTPVYQRPSYYSRPSVVRSSSSFTSSSSSRPKINLTKR